VAAALERRIALRDGECVADSACVH